MPQELHLQVFTYVSISFLWPSKTTVSISTVILQNKEIKTFEDPVSSDNFSTVLDWIM